MAQVCSVIQADPWSLAEELQALGEEIQIVEKTTSAGKFLVVSESPSASQSFEVIAGDPSTLAQQINALGATSIDLIISTFSSAHYVVVYR